MFSTRIFLLIVRTCAAEKDRILIWYSLRYVILSMDWKGKRWPKLIKWPIEPLEPIEPVEPIWTYLTNVATASSRGSYVRTLKFPFTVTFSESRGSRQPTTVCSVWLNTEAPRCCDGTFGPPRGRMPRPSWWQRTYVSPLIQKLSPIWVTHSSESVSWSSDSWRLPVAKNVTAPCDPTHGAVNVFFATERFYVASCAHRGYSTMD